MTDFLILTFLFLGAGIAFVPIATRLGLGSVLGYLLAGIAISPLLSALHVDVVAIQHFAEFGVVMMLFLVGLELEPETLWAMRGKLLGLGGLQVVGTTLLIMAAAMAFGLDWKMALAVGLILCLSSTAIVLQTLNEKGLMKSDAGQNMFSVLLFQDIAVIPMLALMPLLAMPEIADQAQSALEAAGHGMETAEGAAGHAEGTGHAEGISLVAGLNPWGAAAVTLGAIAAVVLGGYYLTRPLFRFVSWARLRELFVATALLIVVGIALLMTLVGLSPALGTFLAGVILASSEYRHELESDIDPFRGLLLGLFFITVGASVNFQLLSENLGTVLGLTFGLMALKALVLLILARRFKMGGADKWLFGLGLAQAGEFGFVLLSFSLSNNIITQQVSQTLLLVVTLSMLLTPLLFILYDKVIAPYYSKELEQEADDMPDDDRNIIICGAGRIGGLVNRMLRFAGYPTTVLDYSAEHLDLIRTFDVEAYYGDATRPDLLHAAGIAKADVCIVAIDDKEHITKLVDYLVKNYPKVHIIARAVDRHHVYELWSAGCRDIIRETYDSSLRMGRSVFEALGMEKPDAQVLTDRFETVDRDGLLEMATLYEPNVPILKNTAYIEKARKWMQEMEDEIEANTKAREARRKARR